MKKVAVLRLLKKLPPDLKSEGNDAINVLGFWAS